MWWDYSSPNDDVFLFSIPLKTEYNGHKIHYSDERNYNHVTYLLCFSNKRCKELSTKERVAEN